MIGVAYESCSEDRRTDLKSELIEREPFLVNCLCWEERTSHVLETDDQKNEGWTLSETKVSKIYVHQKMRLCQL